MSAKFRAMVESGDSYAVALRGMLDRAERNAEHAQRAGDGDSYQWWSKRIYSIALEARDYVSFVEGGR